MEALAAIRDPIRIKGPIRTALPRHVTSLQNVASTTLGRALRYDAGNQEDHPVVRRETPRPDGFQQYNRLYLDLLLKRLMSRWRAYQRAFTAFENVFNENVSDNDDQEDQLLYISKIVGDCEKIIRAQIRQLSAQEEQPTHKPSDIHLAKYDGDYAVLETDIPIHSKIDLILNALGSNISSSRSRPERTEPHMGKAAEAL